MGKALIIVDMLRDFILPGGKLYFARGVEAIPGCKRLRDAFDAAGLPVVYDNDAHPEDSEEFATWPPHCLRGTEGARVVDELAPRPGDLVLEKDSLSMFTIENVANILRERGVDELVLCGVATEYCVLHCALDGAADGFSVTVAQDAVAGVDLNPGDAAAAIEKMRKAGVVLADVSAVVAGLAS